MHVILTHSVFTHLLYAHLNHNRLYLREILWLLHDRLWTAVCVFERWELRTDRAQYETEKGACMRESTSISAIPPIPPSITKLIDNELWLPGKTGRLVTQSLTLQVLRPFFQIASSRIAYPSTAAAILRLDIQTPQRRTVTHILKDKTVNLAYRMYFECPVVLK